MTYEERRTTLVRDPGGRVPTMAAPPDAATDPAVVRAPAVERVEHDVVTRRPRTQTVVARVVAFAFGLVQLVIVLRIVLLVLNARESNEVVAAVLALSRPLVAPFEGIFRTDALASGGAVLDVAAIVALVGWTIVELLVLALVRLGRADEAV